MFEAVMLLSDKPLPLRKKGFFFWVFLLIKINQVFGLFAFTCFKNKESTKNGRNSFKITEWLLKTRMKALC